MARSLDEIFGQTQNKRSLDEIFAPPKAETPSLSLQDLSKLTKTSHTSLNAPTGLKGAFVSGVLKDSALGGMAANAAGVDKSNLYEPRTLPEKAVSFVSSNLADLPLWLGGEALATKAIKPFSKLAPFQKISQALPKTSPILRGGVTDALAYGTTVAPAQTLANNEGVEGLIEREKELPLMFAGGAALRGVGAGIGKGLEIRANNKLNKQVDSLLPQLDNNPLADVQNAYKAPSLRDIKQQEYNNLFSGPNTMFKPAAMKAENPSQYFTKTQSDLESAFPPRQFKSYSFTTAEQRASQALQNGVEKAQNYVGHYDLSSRYPSLEAAYADIKANTGVDLPKLQADYQKTLQAKTSLNPNERRLGKVAGVLPNLKPREILKPGPNVPDINIGKIVEPPKLEPRIWTNDGIKQPSVLSQFEPVKIQTSKVEAPKLEPKAITPKTKPNAEVIESDLPNPTKLKDISGFNAYTNDVYRIFRDVMGEEEAAKFLEPFDKAKEANVNMQTQLLGRLKSEIVDKLGIKKKSKESALVQKYGEGLVSLDDLKRQSPDKWQNIVEADNWFRTEYEKLLDAVNESKKAIYPNAEQATAQIDNRIAEAKASKEFTTTERNDIIKQLEAEKEWAMRGKIVPKRKDYYRHFKELTEGIEALKNIFDSPANINTQLIGTSEFTKPKSKWASFAQKRLGNETEYDAVGGFLDYVPAASYATHIDPQIARFRNLESVLKNTTADTHNADNFLQFLDDFTGDLAGKTNYFDRPLQKMLGRKTFAAVNWLNNRVKANVVLGRASSTLAQFANVPAGIAYAKQYAVPGLSRSVKAIFEDSPDMAKSAFLKERFGGARSKLYRQFDQSLLSKPKEFAVWLMETADKVGTSFIWNSAYEKALAERVADPIRAADMATRSLVAGRGIGEVPLIQKSKIFQVIAPFQLEVANLWRVQQDFVKSKDIAGLMALFVLNYGFNEAMEATTGKRVTFDPINAAKQALTENDISPIQRGGRIVGEVISNIPLGQTLAANIYPEYGTALLPSRKDMFGSNDPTRFGSGLLATRSLSDPLFKVALPFGGDQLKKTYEGIKALNQGGQIKNDKMSFPIAPTLPNKIKTPLFGPAATSEGTQYYKNNERPLSGEQTKKVTNSSDPLAAYKKIMLERDLNAIDEKITAVKKDKKLSQSEKTKKIQELQARKLQAIKNQGR